MRRIAEFLHVDVDTLIAQYDAVFVRAKHIIASSSATPRIDAWRSAVFHRDTRSRGRSAAIRDTAVLVQCLIRAAAFSASSSGCEHTFSVTQWVHEGRRGFVGGELEEDELKLVCDRNGDDDELVKIARRIWADAGYGTPRASGPGARATRVDKGIKRKHVPSADSEIGFLRRRRDAVGAMVAASSSVSMAASSSSVSMAAASSSVSMAAASSSVSMAAPALAWTPSHEKERDHLREKEFDRLVDAVLDGSVQGERLPAEMLELVVREVQRRTRTRTGPRIRKAPEKPASLHRAALMFRAWCCRRRGSTCNVRPLAVSACREARCDLFCRAGSYGFAATFCLGMWLARFLGLRR